MDQREWDYGARMPRDRRAAEPRTTRSPDSPDFADPDPKWASLTDTGSLQPSAEALAWQERADAWAEKAETEKAVEPVSRWSEVAATGRPTFPADGVGWRTETAEWRATGARWRQTTEWRSTTGSHGWRSTTEAWQTGGNESAPPGVETPAAQPAISGTAWQNNASDTPAADERPSWQQFAGPSAEPRHTERPWPTEPERPDTHQAGQPWETGRRTAETPASSTPTASEQTWRRSEPWQPPAQTEPWQQPSPRTPVESAPSWQQLVEPNAPQPSRPAQTPAWRTSAIEGTATWSDLADSRTSGAASGGYEPPQTSAPSWQSARDDGRHLVREDDRAAWRDARSDPGDTSTRIGRRRAPETPAGGTGWDTRSDTDNWAGHTDTGSIQLYPDAPTSDAPSWGGGGRYPTGPASVPVPTPRPEEPTGRRALPSTAYGEPGYQTPPAAPLDGPGRRRRADDVTTRSLPPGGIDDLPRSRRSEEIQGTAQTGYPTGRRGRYAEEAPAPEADQGLTARGGRRRREPGAYPQDPTARPGYATEPPPRGYAEEPPPRGYAEAPPRGYAEEPRGYTAEPRNYADESRAYADESRRSTGQPRGYADDSRGSTGQPRGYADDSRGFTGQPRGYAEDSRGSTGQPGGYDGEMPSTTRGYANETPPARGPAEESRGYAAGMPPSRGYPQEAPARGYPQETPPAQGYPQGSPPARGYPDNERDQADEARPPRGRADTGLPQQRGFAESAPPPSQPGGSQGRARYKQVSDDWREHTGSWSAEPDTSSWTRDPDTGQWSRAVDDPRVLAWREEAARRDASGLDGQQRALPAAPRRADETGAMRPVEDDRRGGGSTPRSGTPYGTPTTNTATPGSAIPGSGMHYGTPPGSAPPTGMSTGSVVPYRGAPDPRSGPSYQGGDPRSYDDGSGRRSWDENGRNGADPRGHDAGGRNGGGPRGYDDGRNGGGPRDYDQSGSAAAGLRGYGDGPAGSGPRGYDGGPADGGPRGYDQSGSGAAGLRGYEDGPAGSGPRAYDEGGRNGAGGRGYGGGAAGAGPRGYDDGGTGRGPGSYDDDGSTARGPRGYDDSSTGRGPRGYDDRGRNGAGAGGYDDGSTGGGPRGYDDGGRGYGGGRDSGARDGGPRGYDEGGRPRGGDGRGGNAYPSAPGSAPRSATPYSGGAYGGAPAGAIPSGAPGYGGPRNGTPYGGSAYGGAADEPSYRSGRRRPEDDDDPPRRSAYDESVDPETWRQDPESPEYRQNRRLGLPGDGPRGPETGGWSATPGGPLPDRGGRQHEQTGGGRPGSADWRTATSTGRATAAGQADWRAEFNGGSPTTPAGRRGEPSGGTAAPAAQADWRAELNGAAAAPPAPADWRTELNGGGTPAAAPQADWRAELSGDGARRDETGPAAGTYREGAGSDWRQGLADSNLAEGESRRFGTSDFVPFQSSGSAAVPRSSNLSMTSTSLISPVPREQREAEAQPRRAGNGIQGLTGSYERRAVTGGLSPGRKSDPLDQDDEDDEQEESGGPLAAVGYTVIWYGVPVVLFLAYMLIVNTGASSHALDTLGKAAPQFGISLVLSILVALGIRYVSSSWKAISVGLAAAVVGGGLATVLTSAITGNSLS